MFGVEDKLRNKTETLKEAADEAVENFMKDEKVEFVEVDLSKLENLTKMEKVFVENAQHVEKHTREQFSSQKVEHMVGKKQFLSLADMVMIERQGINYQGEPS